MAKAKKKISTKKPPPKKANPDAAVRTHLVELLKGGEAHVGFSDALADFPADNRVAAAQGLPHTAWQLRNAARAFSPTI